VKKTPLLAVMAAGVLTFCFTVQSLAQATGARPAAAPAATGLAGKTVLIDINYIFKKHARFNAMMDQLKNEADALDVQMKKEGAQLRNLEIGLQKLSPGSADYKKMEEDVTRAKADFALKVQQQRREFLMREAKAYSDAYREIEYAVDQFCQDQGILLVLKFIGDPIDEKNPDSILTGLNKPVVWYNKNLDITGYILPRFEAPARTADRSGAAGYQGNTQGNTQGNNQGNYAPAGNTVPKAPFNRN
jgi:Skp family chaperone for outer membrane proteins